MGARSTGWTKRERRKWGPQGLCRSAILPPRGCWTPCPCTLQTPVLKFLILSSGRLSSNARMLSSVFPSILSHPFCLYLQTFQFLPRTLSFLRTTPHQTFTPKSPFSSTSFALRTTYSVLRLLLPTVPPLKASSLLDSRLLPQIVIVDTKKAKTKRKTFPFSSSHRHLCA